jgi:O-6-methylguanine DNA methyltransferase
MKKHFIELAIPTRAGRFIARYSGKGLAEMDFPLRSAAVSVRDFQSGGKMPPQPAGVNARATTEQARAVKTNAVPAKIRDWHRATETALKKILAGSAPKTFPPLDLAGTKFQKRVWNALRKIIPGKTKSYGEIARQIGKARAIRAVGGACGANPIPVLVPCHRVLAANKKLGGFSGGLNWKRALLAREGVSFRQNAALDGKSDSERSSAD